MSPERLHASSAASSYKPYSRENTPGTLRGRPADPAKLETHPRDSAVDKPGFPTYACYKEVEASYLNSLHSRRRAKALISQELCDRIMDVLRNNPRREETPQFRFWARKKFTLGALTSDPEANNAAVSDASASDVQNTVLLHQNSIVAIQEDIYDILCFCHEVANHAGRDKTSATVREHYTWIPKDLIANFVKVCPTCMKKKCGNVKSPSEPKQKESEMQRGRSLSASREYLGELVWNYVDYEGKVPALGSNVGRPSPAKATSGEHESRSKSDTTVELLVPDSDSDGTSSPSAFSSASSSGNSAFALPISLDRGGNHSAPPALRTSDTRRPAAELMSAGLPLCRQASFGAPTKTPEQSSVSHPPPFRRYNPPGNGTRSLPMSREVSLFQGLPNGWQYHFSDYATAREDFLARRAREEENDGSEGKKSAVSSCLSVRSGGSGYAKRPRVPSVVPLMPADFPGNLPETSTEEDLALLASEAAPATGQFEMKHAPSHGDQLVEGQLNLLDTGRSGEREDIFLGTSRVD